MSYIMDLKNIKSVDGNKNEFIKELMSSGYTRASLSLNNKVIDVWGSNCARSMDASSILDNIPEMTIIKFEGDKIMKRSPGLGGIIGFIFGAIVGYLLRPSAFLIGQLSFEHVISRGATLKGMDQMLKPLAETSNNYMLAGGVIFGIVGAFIFKKR